MRILTVCFIHSVTGAYAIVGPMDSKFDGDNYRPGGSWPPVITVANCTKSRRTSKSTDTVTRYLTKPSFDDRVQANLQKGQGGIMYITGRVPLSG